MELFAVIYGGIWLLVWLLWFVIIWNDEGRPKDMEGWAGAIVTFIGLGIASIFWPLLLGVLGLAFVLDAVSNRR